MPALLILAMLAAGAAAGTPAFAQEAKDQSAAPPGVKVFFSVRSAKPDAAIPEEVAKNFDNYKGEPLESLEYDLDGDGQPEKFILDRKLSLSSGNQWLIYSEKNSAVIGLITGTLVFVLDQTDNGMPRLETFWRQGGDMAVVFDYSFGTARYTRQSSRSLTLLEIGEYFRTKPPVDKDSELGGAVVKDKPF